jgi:penicillin-binding protein 1C
MTRTSRRWKPVAAIAAGAALLVACLAAFWVLSLGPVPLGTRLDFSTVVVDRDGRLLRPYATPEGRWRLPAQADGVDPRYLSLLIEYEDKRFRSHAGVDPAALLRAAGQIISHRHIVSGGSTLTMQVARLLEPRSERSLAAKLRQLVRAIELERALTKDEVLGLYLSLAPYGGNLEGIRAASLAYFGKEPRRLTLGESALLVALPQSPEAAARPLRRRVATGARPRARSHRFERPVRRYRDRAGQSRAGARRTDADADACRAFRRRGSGGSAGAFAHPPHYRRHLAG